ncbi:MULTISPECIES: MOSC domain-containing protein [unclassified Solwaraspora]|uniref:MOSC domain-containing protein n=1 Tax=unclassified Solwaraspora TaxID=2627926 RepID=UPI00259B66FC|nr:MOSC N-terminal beta barrel domain-containing protein [Solwaraspora sp. WMMA2056]WJK40283.1 MOSC domain-containing protein [Solwaraspora sp. WMMA2056]
MRVAALHTYPVKGCRRLDHDAARVEPWGLAGDRRWMIVDPDGVGLTQREVPALVTVHPGPAADGSDLASAVGLTLRGAGRPTLDVPAPVDGEPVPVRVFRSKVAVPARLAAPTAHDWLSDLLERPARLVWLADPTVRAVDPDFSRPGDTVSFADGYPVLLTSTASLDAVNDWLVGSGDPAAPLPMHRFRPNVVLTGAPAWAEDGWLGQRIRIGAVTFRVAKTCARCVVTTTDQDTGERGPQPLRILGQHRRGPKGVLFGMNLIPDGTGRIAVGDPVAGPADPVSSATGPDS